MCTWRKVVAPLGQADAGSIDAARRMHRLGYKLFDAAMVHLALPPVVVFLRLLPLRRQELAAKGVSASLQHLDHRQSVVALRAFDSERSEERRVGKGCS